MGWVELFPWDTGFSPRIEVFLPESAVSADSVMMFVPPLCAVTCINIYGHIKIQSTGRHTIVWMQDNTAQARPAFKLRGKIWMPNGRELEAVTHTIHLPPPPTPLGVLNWKQLHKIHWPSAPPPPSWNGCATSIKRRMQKLKNLEAAYQLFAVLLMMYCSCFRIGK